MGKPRVDLRKTFNLRQNIYPSFSSEKEAQISLGKILNGRLEVKCKYGRIDVLTDEYIIEVKKYSSHGAKMALGQILVYATLYDYLQPTVAFLGEEKVLWNEVGEQWGINVWWTLDGRWQIGYNKG